MICRLVRGEAEIATTLTLGPGGSGRLRNGHLGYELLGANLSADGDPLFLQVKTAVGSVLEPHVSSTDSFSDPGERVVVSQRLMQAAGDPLLGWVAGGEGGHHFYVRQLRDMKVSADLTRMSSKGLNRYTESCGQVLAHAHAGTGDPAMIAGYLGKSSAFDEALADFAVAYANQTEVDHAALQEAIADGRVTPRPGSRPAVRAPAGIRPGSERQTPVSAATRPDATAPCRAR